MLPPIELPSRIAGLGYTAVHAGRTTQIASRSAGAVLEISGQAAQRSTRARLTLEDDIPSGIDDLPRGRELMGKPARIAFKGPPPDHGDLYLTVDVQVAQLPFLDPYGWDGTRWQWLAISSAANGVVRIRVPFDRFVPPIVVLTLATGASTAVSAVLLPPPSVVPAAVAELPILEMAAFHLVSGDGALSGDIFPIPARPAGRYAVVDNREGVRVRSDLVANMLANPESRKQHRKVLAELARRRSLAGLILDYRLIPGDLQSIYAEWLARLGRDLREVGAELVVVVPMPIRRAGGWDSSPASWSALSAGADGLRVLLPADEPLEIEALDDMVRWALGQVDRRKLQLGVPVEGRDVSEEGTIPVGFGPAFARVLDMARSDAPARLSPGDTAVVELPALREAGLMRDPGVGMWRFDTWDDVRRKHTVWINDARGLRPAFEIALRYRLGQLALHGVEAGLDPALWPLVRSFRLGGLDPPSANDYQLEWQLLADDGRVAREARQPLGVADFRFRAPADEGHYRLRVDLVTGDGNLVAPGLPRDLTVGPAPPPPPTPTPPTLLIEPTRSSPATRPPPADELTINRPPVTANVTPSDSEREAADAVVSLPEGVLRGGPGVSHPVVSSIRQGERLNMVGRSTNGKWYLVSVEATGVTGWVRDEFVELNVDPSSVPTLSETPAAP